MKGLWASSAGTRRRAALATGMAAGVAAALAAGPAPAEELKLLGAYALPAGLEILGVDFGGLSALDYEAGTGLFLALSDDRGEHGPPRFYELKIDLSEKGPLGLDIRGQTPIRLEDGLPPEPGAIDPEALRLGPDGVIYWAQEGGASGVPSVGVMARDGAWIADFRIPGYYAPALPAAEADAPAPETAPEMAAAAAEAEAAGGGGDADPPPPPAPQGVRDNYGFEALAVDAEGRLVVGVEQALIQDGPKSDLDHGALTRILVLSPGNGGPVAEYVYPVDRIPSRPVPPNSFAANGLVELLARPEGGFYALERSYSVGQGNRASIYVFDFEGASNVLGAESLAGLAPRPVRKRLLYTLQAGTAGLAAVDNLEGMSFGPELNGARTLLLISDDNFSRGEQATQILLFAIEES